MSLVELGFNPKTDKSFFAMNRSRSHEMINSVIIPIMVKSFELMKSYFIENEVNKKKATNDKAIVIQKNYL